MINELEKNLLTALENDFINRNEWLYLDDESETGFLKKEFKNNLNDFLEEPGSSFVDLLEDLSLFYLSRFQYQSKFDKNKAINSFLLSSLYGFYSINIGNKCCRCYKSRVQIAMHRTMIMFSSLIITKDWVKVEEIGENLLSSVNGKSCIIRRGDREDTKSWFLLDLYCKIENKIIDEDRAERAEISYPYDEVLDNWDTKNIKDVERLICLLIDSRVNKEFEDVDFNYDEYALLKTPLIQLFHYEVLVWLILREKHGLENPKTISHALMNTEFIKLLLSNPKYEKIDNLMYLPEILEKINEKCFKDNPIKI